MIYVAVEFRGGQQTYTYHLPDYISLGDARKARYGVVRTPDNEFELVNAEHFSQEK